MNRRWSRLVGKIKMKSYAAGSIYSEMIIEVEIAPSDFISIKSKSFSKTHWVLFRWKVPSFFSDSSMPHPITLFREWL